MKYEAKIIPEDINTSRENPLKEFFILVGGAGLIILLIIIVTLFSSDFLVKYIPIELEQRWFSADNFSTAFPSDIQSDDQIKTDLRKKTENYLQNITASLKDEKHAQFIFNVKLLDESTPNAFITPGGNIFVTSGLLESISSENALAMVLGHEMGHQYHRHPIRSAGRGIIFTLAFFALSGFEVTGVTQSFIGNTANIANLAFSREQEREADETGVELLISQYGHAQDASQFFHEMKQIEQQHSNVPVFLRTHPGTNERIEFLNQYENTTKGDTIPLPQFITDYIKSASTNEH